MTKDHSNAKLTCTLYVMSVNGRYEWRYSHWACTWYYHTCAGHNEYGVLVLLIYSN